jgi:hypothetical protein
MCLRLRLSLRAWRRLCRRIDSRRSRLRWRERFFYWLNGASYSLLIRIQHASYADKLKTAVPSAPIFLLGFWRSGTTLLHELFCCDPRFGFPSTYACMNSSHFLLTERWNHAGKLRQQTRRPMDSMRYSWASPQEDEFALLALGAPSPYEALIVPSLMRDPKSLLDMGQLPREEEERWKKAMRYFLQLLTVQQGKTMVLKSPPHGFRLPTLPTIFPNARYVIIERNPYEVFASNLKLWQTLLEMYSLESISPDEIEAFVLAAYVLHEEAVAEGTRQINPRSLARVRYEDLVADSVGQMERLYAELGLENFETVRQRLDQHAASVADHTRNRFTLTPLQKARVDAQWGTLIKQKGYECPGDHVSVLGPVHSGHA